MASSDAPREIWSEIDAWQDEQRVDPGAEFELRYVIANRGIDYRIMRSGSFSTYSKVPRSPRITSKMSPSKVRSKIDAASNILASKVHV